MTKYRARPYDYRRDGAAGGVQPLSYPGGIFGGPPNPRNHTGIFESHYAIPAYVEQAELDGGPLFSDTLRADATQSDPIERDIGTPDLGPPVRDLYPQPFKRRRPLPPVARPGQRIGLGADPAPAPAPAIVERPGLLGRPVAGPLALMGLGVLIAYVVFGK